MNKPNNDQSTLKEIALLFLRLGLTAFGGPAAHIAMMQTEVVVKRKWMTDEHFLDLLGATNLIPGPNSTELAIHIGKERGGWAGLIIAGLCFILPAVFITGLLAFFYKEYGSLPTVQPFIYGIKPAVIAVIVFAVYPLAVKSSKTSFLIGLGIFSVIFSFFRVSEIIVIFGCGLMAVIYEFLVRLQSKNKTHTFGIFSVFIPVSASLIELSSTQLFLVFLKIGSILYGSGYVLFAFLDTELVQNGWLTAQQLTDAIAVGQFTPGPVFSSVTFIGYQIDNFQGALLATIGIFLPSFLFVALLNPVVRFMRSSVYFSHFLDAVNIASVAVIAAVCYRMGLSAVTDWRTMLIAVCSLLILLRFRTLNSAWIILGGSIAGYVFSLI